MSNEVLLFHGTTPTKAKDILMQGFDDRLASKRDLYGQGVYFTTELCKALQYCKDADADGSSRL